MQGAMKRQIRVFGLPVHPFLVHFPIAFWLATPILDATVIFFGPEPWWRLSLAAVIIGAAFGAAAIATGLLEYLQPSLAGVDLRLAARHGVRTSLAWCIFVARAFIAAILGSVQWAIGLILVMDLIGSAILIQGVIFGTRQVYQQLEK